MGDNMNKILRWVKASERLPEKDHYDEPKRYVVRFRGDDPRSGWIDVRLLTAEKMLDTLELEYVEWLEETEPQTNEGVTEEMIYEKIISKVSADVRKDSHSRVGYLVDINGAGDAAKEIHQQFIEPLQKQVKELKEDGIEVAGLNEELEKKLKYVQAENERLKKQLEEKVT